MAESREDSLIPTTFIPVLIRRINIKSLLFAEDFPFYL